jgi:nicotinamidase/pyrazinamidase
VLSGAAGPDALAYTLKPTPGSRQRKNARYWRFHGFHLFHSREKRMPFQPQAGDALVIVDLQNDFLPGGALAVPQGDAVIAPLNDAIAAFEARGLPIFATRDWHPREHCSFTAQGGIWPPHCVADTRGAAFADALRLPRSAIIVSKADTARQDAYSGFGGTDLAAQLAARGVMRLLVGGLATDYCVLNTVLDGLAAGFEVLLLEEAMRAVEVTPGDGAAAMARMRQAGAQPVQTA